MGKIFPFAAGAVIAYFGLRWWADRNAPAQAPPPQALPPSASQWWMAEDCPAVPPRRDPLERPSNSSLVEHRLRPCTYPTPKAPGAF